MTPDPTPPSGESAPPSLMDCWDDEKQIKYLKTCVMQMETALLASEHLRQHAEAEVARLTAELVCSRAEAHNYADRRLDEALRADAAEARAARAEAALREVREMLNLPMTLCYKRSAAGGLLWDAKEVECIHNRVLYSCGVLDRALTEGAEK